MCVEGGGAVGFLSNPFHSLPVLGIFFFSHFSSFCLVVIIFL